MSTCHLKRTFRVQNGTKRVVAAMAGSGLRGAGSGRTMLGARGDVRVELLRTRTPSCTSSVAAAATRGDHDVRGAVLWWPARIVVAQREGGTAAPLACALVTASGRPARWRDSVPGSACGFVNCLCQRVTNACKWRADAVSVQSGMRAYRCEGSGRLRGVVGCVQWVRSAPTTRQPAADTLVRSV